MNAPISSSRSPGTLPKVTKYNGVATAGSGISPIRAFSSLMANSTSGATIASFTVGASDGVFEVGGFIAITAWTSGSVSMSVNWTDAHGNARSFSTMTGLRSDTGTLGATMGATGDFALNPLIISAQAGTTISLKTSASGTNTADYFAFIRQVG